MTVRELYRKRRNYFLTIARKKLREPALAEDVVHEAVEVVMRRWENVRDPVTFLVGVIHKIAMRENKNRRAHRDLDTITNVSDNSDLELVSDVRRVVRELFPVPEEFAAVWLYYAHGFTRREVALWFPSKSHAAWGRFLYQARGRLLTAFEIR